MNSQVDPIPPNGYSIAYGSGMEHRYFWLEGRLCIADQSGKWPHECDDGLLYVNQMEMPTIEGGRVNIPLIDEHNTTSTTGGNLSEVFAVAKLMGKMVRIVDPNGTESFVWPLNVDDAETQALAREQVARQENAELKVKVSKLELGIQTLINSLKE
tara:strand:+ start:156 stop:623 length:468 start_codon:yes stop_codon:yes gene_type:complete